MYYYINWLDDTHAHTHKMDKELLMTGVEKQPNIYDNTSFLQGYCEENVWTTISTQVGVGGDLLLLLIQLFSSLLCKFLLVLTRTHTCCFLCHEVTWEIRISWLQRSIDATKLLSCQSEHSLWCWYAADLKWFKCKFADIVVVDWWWWALNM